jgi:hypothetical protein
MPFFSPFTDLRAAAATAAAFRRKFQPRNLTPPASSLPRGLRLPWLLLPLLCPALLPGQSSYSITPGLLNGTAVRLVSSTPTVVYEPLAYNSTTECLDLMGFFVLPNNRDVLDFQPYIQGVAGTAITLFGIVPGGRSYTFRVTLPIPGCTAIPTPSLSRYYSSGTLMNKDQIVKPVISELYDNRERFVRARDFIVIYDTRFDPRFARTAPPSPVLSGLQLELTQRGLNNSEETNQKRLPYPSISGFGDVLGLEFNRRPKVTHNTITTLASSLATCRSINEVPEFRDTPEYTRVYTDALSQYFMLEAARQTTGSGAASASIIGALSAINPVLGAAAAGLSALASASIEATACVRRPPVEADFEVCAGTIEGKGQTLRMLSAESVNFALGRDGASPPVFSANPEVGNLTGTVSGKFTNLFIRFKENPGKACIATIRPASQVRPSAGTPAFTAVDCNQLTVAAERAVASQPLDFTLLRPVGNGEDIDYSPALQPANYFALQSFSRNRGTQGWCNYDFAFRTATDAYLDKFQSRVRDALNNAWRSGDPATQHALSLKEQFAHWTLGLSGDLALRTSPTGQDHTLDFQYSPSASANLHDRYFVRFNGSAFAAKPITGLSGNYVLTPPTVRPCANNSCGTNLSPTGTRFDFGFHYTTSLMNHIVAQLATTTLLNFEWRPTYAELGITPPGGTPDTARVPLDTTTLASIFPALSGLPAGTIAIKIAIPSTFKPFLYINPQPERTANWQEGQTDLVYNAPTVNIDIEFNGTRVLAGLLHVNHRNFQLNPSFTSDKLDAAWSLNLAQNALGPASLVFVQESSIPGCGYGQLFGGFPQGCADQLLLAIHEKLRPLLAGQLLYVADRFPAPLTLKSGGTTLRFSKLEKYQNDQVLAFYGELAK